MGRLRDAFVDFIIFFFDYFSFLSTGLSRVKVQG